MWSQPSWSACGEDRVSIGSVRDATSNGSQRAQETYVAIFQIEYQRVLVTIVGFRDELRCHPSFSRVRLPCLGADLVEVRHRECCD